MFVVAFLVTLLVQISLSLICRSEVLTLAVPHLMTQEHLLLMATALEHYLRNTDRRSYTQLGDWSSCFCQFSMSESSTYLIHSCFTASFVFSDRLINKHRSQLLCSIPHRAMQVSCGLYSTMLINTDTRLVALPCGQPKFQELHRKLPSGRILPPSRLGPRSQDPCNLGWAAAWPTDQAHKLRCTLCCCITLG